MAIGRPYADITKTKDYITFPLDDQNAEERLKNFMNDADDWIDTNLRALFTTPLILAEFPQGNPSFILGIASKYAAGLFMLANDDSKDKDPQKRPAVMIQAEKELKIWMDTNQFGVDTATTFFTL